MAQKIHANRKFAKMGRAGGGKGRCLGRTPWRGMPEYTFSGSFDARSSRKRDSHLVRNTEGEIVVTFWTETLTRNAT